MDSAKINVNVDKGTKEAVEVLLDEMGLTMTAAINMYLKRILLEQGIPFDVNVRTPNAVTIAALDEFTEMQRNPGAYKKYPTFKAAMNEVLEDA